MSQKRKSNADSSTTALSQSKNKRQDPTSAESDAEEIFTNHCVRFFIFKLKSLKPISRIKVIRYVFRKQKPGRLFEKIFTNANKILQDIYSIKVVPLQKDSSSKKYILINIVEHQEVFPKSLQTKFKASLTFLILKHIFMSHGTCTEDSLLSFLQALKIIPNENGYVNGVNLNLFIKCHLVKQEMLTMHVLDDEDNQRIKFSWGAVAEQTVMKMNILNFFSKVYHGIDIKKWPQYPEAVKQLEDQEE